MSSTTTLHVHHAFCTFLCLHCTATTWNAKSLSLLGNGNGKAINSTISARTWARSPLFGFSQNPLLLSNKANWDNREKVENDAKSVFQRSFHGRRRSRIVRSLIGMLRRLRKRHIKSEFALRQTVLRLFHLVKFVKCWQFFFSWILINNYSSRPHGLWVNSPWGRLLFCRQKAVAFRY